MMLHYVTIWRNKMSLSYCITSKRIGPTHYEMGISVIGFMPVCVHVV